MFDLEIRKPSRQTLVGFLVAWVCVTAIILLTMLLSKVGANASAAM